VWYIFWNTEVLMVADNQRSSLRAAVSSLDFSPTLAVNERVRVARLEGRDVYHLGFGQSPFPVHPMVQAALQEHAAENRYLPSAGLPALRVVARDYYARRLGLAPERYQSIIGPGSKELIYDLQMATAGDLLLPVPSWVSYAPQARLLGDRVIPIQTTLADGYHIRGESLDAAIHAARKAGLNPRKLILNYPNNPSGLTMRAGRLAEIAEVCRQYQLFVISDEIYGLLDFSGEHTSIARFYPEGTVITAGLSKHLSLGGYRLGVALFPDSLKTLQAALARIASETWSCVSTPVQYAALAAYCGDGSIEAYIHTCTRVHGMVCGYVRDSLLGMGIEYPSLEGGFYLYPDFSIFREQLGTSGVTSSEVLAVDLMEKVQVVTLPGTAFGDDPENLRLRLAPCDYDGQATLDGYNANPEGSPEAFVRSFCPRIWEACERLRGYFGG
jgi:aspartate/methionine/tyrosine aminotransferase